MTLFNFDGASGSLPFGGLVEDANGNFYGATYSGGAYGDGVIYEISAVTHNFTVLASFNGTTEGGGPIGTLSVDAAGNLYGETENSVFELANGSSTITTLATLPANVYPSGSLVVSPQGTIYGTTTNGGDLGEGSIFAIAPGQKSVTTLASFNGYDGTHPYAGLTIDAAGNLLWVGAREHGHRGGARGLLRIAGRVGYDTNRRDIQLWFLWSPGRSAGRGFERGFVWYHLEHGFRNRRWHTDAEDDRHTQPERWPGTGSGQSDR